MFQLNCSTLLLTSLTTHKLIMSSNMSWWAYNWTIKTIWWRRWWRKSKDDLPHFEVECSTNIHWHGNKFVFGKVMDAFGYMQWQRMMVVKHDTGQTKVLYLVREMIMWGMYVRCFLKQEAYEFIKIAYKDGKNCSMIFKYHWNLHISHHFFSNIWIYLILHFLQ